MHLTLEKRLRTIEERNVRVEAEKAWEKSFTRRLFLALMTYVAAMLLFWSLGLPAPLFQALIPSAAYLLSTLSLPWLKKWWMRWQRSMK